MSYARLGPNSDVYVYSSIGGFFSCHWCQFNDGKELHFKWSRQVLRHLKRHVAAGHKVPDYCFKALRAERWEVDLSHLGQRLGRRLDRKAKP